MWMWEKSCQVYFRFACEDEDEDDVLERFARIRELSCCKSSRLLFPRSPNSPCLAYTPLFSLAPPRGAAARVDNNCLPSRTAGSRALAWEKRWSTSFKPVDSSMEATLLYFCAPRRMRARASLISCFTVRFLAATASSCFSISANSVSKAVSSGLRVTTSFVAFPGFYIIDHLAKCQYNLWRPMRCIEILIGNLRWLLPLPRLPMPGHRGYCVAGTPQIW